MSTSHTAAISQSSKPSHKDRIHPVGSADGPLFEAIPSTVREAAAALAKARKFSARCGETLVLALDGAQWVFVGIGKPGQLSRPDFAQALASAFAEARRAGLRAVSLHVPEN